jgi:hypothetical protein
VETNNDAFAIKKNKALMSAKVMINGVERLVEVFPYAILTVKLQIRIDGKKIAGDEFLTLNKNINYAPTAPDAGKLRRLCWRSI